MISVSRVEANSNYTKNKKDNRKSNSRRETNYRPTFKDFLDDLHLEQTEQM